MKVLTNNKKYLIISDKKQTHLILIDTLQIIKTRSFPYDVATIQPHTKIATLCKGGIVSMYGINQILYDVDFQYQKQRYYLDTYQVIKNVGFAKNILIVISAQRILLHDVLEKKTITYINICNTTSAFINADYYYLRIFYVKENKCAFDQSIWFTNHHQIPSIAYQHGCYGNNGQLVCLTQQNAMTIYKSSQPIKIYFMHCKIIDLKSTQIGFYVLLQDGQIVEYEVNCLKLYQQFIEFARQQTSIKLKNIAFWKHQQNMYKWNQMGIYKSIGSVNYLEKQLHQQQQQQNKCVTSVQKQ